MLKNASPALREPGKSPGFQLLRPQPGGVVFSDAFSLASGKRMMGSGEAHHMLRTRSEPDSFGFYTGTAIAFEAPGKPFGSHVRFENMGNIVGMIEVPQIYQGIAGMALVMEHPSYSMVVRDGICTFACSNPIPIEIPAEDGWYRVDPMRGLPIGRREDGPVEELYLFLRSASSYVGPVVRGGDSFGRKAIEACIDYSSWRAGVLVQEQAAREEKLLVA